MGIVGRLVRIAIVAALALVLVLAGFLGFATYRALPQTDGQLKVPGLEEPVTVLRDAAGIAQIYAETPHDLFLAQGYVHAQDRLWQMEVWRHISSGRLSELFGRSTLDQDRFIRTLGWRQAAERDLEALSTESLDALDAYAEGVNAYIDGHRGGLGLSFVVTGFRAGIGGIGGYDLEPWTALDSLAWQKVQAWELGGNFQAEVFRMLADEKLGDPAMTDALFPAYPADGPVITPTGLAGSGGAGAGAASTGAAAADAGAMPSAALGDAEAAAWRDVAGLGDEILALAGLDAGAGLAGDHQVGSNNWVVGADRSASGGALLANDPHLGIAMPSVWFMNGLHCRTVSAECPYDVVGVSFPGIPAVVLGHNARIAWGATNVDPDVQDLFIEDVDEENPDNYFFRGDSVPFTVREEIIKVAGEDEFFFEIRETVHGPILNSVDDRLSEAPPLAMRWTATSEEDGTFEAIRKVNVASDFDEFRAAFATYGSPSQNFVYADVDGHIGYVFPGHVPIRADPKDLGARIRPGSDGEHEWTGMIPIEDLPWQLDPPDAVIVTANNAAVDGDYPYFVAQEWDPGYRARRILDLLDEAAESDDLSAERFRDIQMDGRVLRADLVMPFLEEAAPETDDGQAVLDRIESWDGHAGLDSTGASAYFVAEYRIMRALFDDELSDLASEYVGGGASWQAMIGMLGNPESPWWDDVTTLDETETREVVVNKALDAAGAELRKALGDPSSWTWSRLHQATFREQTLGTSGIGPIEGYFNKGPYAVDGASGAINNTYFRPSRGYPDPEESDPAPAGLTTIFEVTNLPSYRLTIDMSDLDGARIVQTTGQSGNPADSHYGDLIDEWAAGETVPLPFTEAAVEAAAVRRLELVP
ncbi:MAG TPA: penicillin acylase family protein [Candidatus Limnocylindrales bacterium]|nr:penicillin acylase family protein [Candidatus Limnocylindrales bacterium]